MGPIKTENLCNLCEPGLPLGYTAATGPPKHDKQTPQTKRRIQLTAGGDGKRDTHLNDRANFAGRSASNGRVRKATKKHTAAPSKHPMNPSSLTSTHYEFWSSKMIGERNEPFPSRQRKPCFLFVRTFVRA
jgi:hypothetical protein